MFSEDLLGYYLMVRSYWSQLMLNLAKLFSFVIFAILV